MSSQLQEIVFSLIANTREDARKKVVRKFLDENPGTGKGSDCSRYEYTVEYYECYKIVLKRPGTFKKGFDFTVNIRGMYFKKHKRYENPSFDDIINVLECLKRDIPNKYHFIATEINNIFKLKGYNFSKIKNIEFNDYQNNPHPIGIILLAIKWLFISEDISYWNWSGRNMFMQSLQDKNLI